MLFGCRRTARAIYPRAMAKTCIYTGVGGWTYEPWRGVFYPKGLPHARELSYAAEHLTSIEVNGTFYSTQSPKTFRKWASEVPDEFVFSLKGPRYAVNRRVLREAGNSIKRFLDSGITELGAHLGPLLWQFAPSKKFDEADFGGFLELLPKTFDGRSLRHAIEVRHDSFKTPAFIALLRKFGMPASSMPSTILIPRSPTSPPTSSTRGCRRATKSSKPAIRRRHSINGQSARKAGRAAASRTTCRRSTRHPRQNNRATSSSISSTRRSCARRPPRWR